MEHKSFAVSELKAVADADAPGTFEAIVSVFGNVDQGGDIVEKGAFKKSLETRGLPPIVWSHEWHTPPIGVTLKAEERDEGLYIKGRLFVGENEDSPVARAVYTAMRSEDGNGKAALREFSFGYQAVDYEMEKAGDAQIRRLKEVDIFEAGPTLMGMNPETQLLGVKSLEKAVAAEIAVKAGRVLSKSNETKLADAHAAIGEVLSQVADTAPEDTPKNLPAPVADETQPADNPTPNSTADVDEEAEARIGALLLARPQIITTEEQTA
jgi:HK97 family phage prohead protease